MVNSGLHRAEVKPVAMNAATKKLMNMKANPHFLKRIIFFFFCSEAINSIISPDHPIAY